MQQTQDFNHNRTLGAVLPVVTELERHPIVAYIEDPLKYDDIDGWRRLREQTRIPLVMQGVPIPHVQMLQYGLADVYMLSGKMRDIMGFGWACSSANTPVILQEAGGGGMLGKAMSLHMAAVMPTHSAHMVCLEDQYDEPMYTEHRIPVINGSSPVPEGPGLGYKVNEAELRRMSRLTPLAIPKHLGVLSMGTDRYYGASYVSPLAITGQEEGMARGFKNEVWVDDGSAEFKQLYKEVHGIADASAGATGHLPGDTGQNSFSGGRKVVRRAGARL